MMKMRGLIWIALTLAVVGCVPTTQSSADEGYTARIIVKFSDRIENPADNRYVQELSREVGVTLTYLQPMSGAAHVFEVRNVQDAAELDDVLRQLAAQPDVVYTEQDRSVRTH